MLPEEEAVWSVVKEMEGKTLVEIHRVLDEFHGEIQKVDGYVQLSFDDDTTFLLTGSSDGNTLGIRNSPWNDPFQGELDDETLNWIEKYGKSILVDMADITPFNGMIGQAVRGMVPIFHELNRLCGVQFLIGDSTLNFVYAADQCLLISDEELIRRVKIGYTVGDDKATRS